MNDRARLGLALGLVLVVGALGASFLLELRSEAETPDLPAATAAARSDIPFEEQQRRIRVEVLNGAGDPGAAARITEALRGAGFDVKTYGNAARFDYEQSIVLDRSGRPGAAGAVAAVLNGVDVEEQLDPELYLDATVILGDDWRALVADSTLTEEPR
ncbi:MAG: LytR C-terminal domain-containing protein [Gemmatimonadetes bacterium]|nr:LytR C-terminal domain-containing protein [Gemmatimonadota bacterium]